jgi:transcriptional regulator GlxA family with amidase domain
MLYPEVSLVQRATAEFMGQKQLPYFPNPVIQDQQLATQLRQLHIVIENSTSVLERESCFLWTIAQLVRRYGDRRPFLVPIRQEHQVVQRIQDYLRANYANSISLEQLAYIANLKPLRLLRSFRREVGLPPHAYLVQVRVTRAKAMLSLGVPIAQVAADTGFTDQSHLTRHFKRLVGVTPRQYTLGCCKNVQDLLL